MSIFNQNRSNDNSVLIGSTYNQLIGIFSKLKAWLDGKPNLLEMITEWTEVADQYVDYSVWVTEKYGSDILTWVNNLDIPIETTAEDCYNLIDGEGITTDTRYVHFNHILMKIFRVEKEILPASTTVSVYVYSGGEPHEISTMSITDAIACVGSNREIVESCLTSLEELMKCVEGEVEDFKDYLMTLQPLISTNAYNAILSVISNVRQSIGGALNNSTVSIYFFGILQRFGFPVSQGASTDKSLTYNGTAPAVAWLNTLSCYFGSIPNTVGEIVQWELGVAATFWKFLIKGIEWVVDKLVNKVFLAPIINTIGKTLGVSGGVQVKKKFGDDTIDNGFALVTFPVNTAVQPEYTPPEVQYIASHIGQQANHIVTIPLTGSRFEYQMDDQGNYVQLRMYTKILSFEKVLNVFNKHFITFPIQNTSTPYGYEITSFDYSGLTNTQWYSLLEDLRSADLTYEEPDWQHNFNYIRGMLAARFVTLVELACIWCNFDNEHFTHVYDEISTIITHNVDAYVDIINASGTHGANWTNKFLISYACNGFNGNQLVYGVFNIQTGYDDSSMNTWYSNPDRDICTLFLYPMTVASGILNFSMANSNLWLTYLDRSLLNMSSYHILGDEEVSSAATASVGKALGQIAIIVATVLAVKYIPAFLQYKRTLAARVDYLAFSVGENPDDQSIYNDYKKTRLKNALLSKVLGGSTVGAATSFTAMSPLSKGSIVYDDEDILTAISAVSAKIG